MEEAMNPLKIEVTGYDAITQAALDAMFAPDAPPGYNWPGNMRSDMKAALTAAFQHPEFVRQIREQVLACVPAKWTVLEGDHYGVRNRAIDETRASLGRLLGEEGK